MCTATSNLLSASATVTLRKYAIPTKFTISWQEWIDDDILTTRLAIPATNRPTTSWSLTAAAATESVAAIFVTVIATKHVAKGTTTTTNVSNFAAKHLRPTATVAVVTEVATAATTTTATTTAAAATTFHIFPTFAVSASAATKPANASAAYVPASAPTARKQCILNGEASQQQLLFFTSHASAAAPCEPSPEYTKITNEH